MRFIVFLIGLGYSVILSSQERITLLFAGDLMQHAEQINAAHTNNGYDYSDCFKHIRKEIS